MAGTKLPKAIRAAIGIRLRAHRKAAQIGQVELAEMADISASQLSRMESAQSTGSINALLYLAWVLEIEPAELLPDLEELQAVFGAE